VKKKPSIPNEHVPPDLWLCLGLGLLILIFFLNSFTAGLVYDAGIIIPADTRIQELNLTNLKLILTRDYWWPTDASTLYRPLTTLSYLVNYAVLGNGENPAGYHIVNFLLHWANVWLVFLIIRRLASRLDVALVAAALFAIHPVNTEAVTNIVGRADLLATFFVLLGGWWYLQGRLAGVAVAGCLGVLAKETGVMLVAFAGLYDLLWSEGLRPILKKFRLEYLAFIPGIILIGLIRSWMMSTTMVFEDDFTDNPLFGATFFQRFMTAMEVIGRHLKLLVFPWSLSGDYSFNQIPLYNTGSTSSDVAAWLSILTVALLIAAAIYLRNRAKLFSWGVLFLFIMMLPTSNLLVVIGSIMAERFLYLPLIGFCGALAFILLKISGQTHFRWVLPAVVICLLGIRTFQRNADWHDELSFWKSTVAASPGSIKAHMVYGDTIIAHTERAHDRPLAQAVDEAIPQEETARSILEGVRSVPVKWRDINIYLHLAKDYRLKGQFLDDAGHHSEAASFYQKSLDTLMKAQEIDQYTNQAFREFRIRRGSAPENIPAFGNTVLYESLCFTYAKVGEWEKCEVAGRYLQRIAPQLDSSYELLGAAYFNLGRYREAADQFLAGLLVHPEKPDWLPSLSRAYENMGAGPNPVANQGTSFTLNKDMPLVREQLNRVVPIVIQLFRQAGKWDEANTLRERLVKQYSVL
jgi:tetratricopeptide (TPR) repeat protein